MRLWGLALLPLVVGAAVPVIRGFTLAAAAGNLAVTAHGMVYFTQPSRDRIGELDPLSGAIRTFKVPSANAGLRGLTWGGDGWLTFAEARAGKIGRLEPASGQFREFPTAEGLAPDVPVVIGKRIYFSAPAAGAIGMLDPASGEGAAYALPGPGAEPEAMAPGPNGDLYYCTRGGHRLGRFDPRSDRFTQYSPSTPAAGSCAIAIAGATLYFTESAAGKLAAFDLVSHALKEWPSPGGSGSHPGAIAIDRAATVWYDEGSPQRLVHFVPRDQSFTTLALPWRAPLGALAIDPSGGLWLAPGEVNKLALIESP